MKPSQVVLSEDWEKGSAELSCKGQGKQKENPDLVNLGLENPIGGFTMKLVKSLLLGSAAGLMAVTGSMAADLPSRKAAPAEYVRVCSAYGAGFFFIPGSDTCLQISGRARAQYQFASQRDAQSSTVGFRAALRIGLDARTQTEYGTLRAVARLSAERRTGAANTGTGNRAGTIINGAGEPGNALQTQINVEAAFIQFAGITAGRAPSFFNDVMSVDDYHGLHYSGLGSGATNLLAYTASFGGGFSATLSLEDSLERRLFNDSVTVNALGIATAGATQSGFTRTSRSVDVVANLRLDQSWGSLGLSGAIVPHTFGSSTAFAGFAMPGDKYGYAIAAAAKINLPFLTPGSNFQLTGAYGKGANSYVWGNAWHHSSNGANGAVGQRLNSLTAGDVVITNNGVSLSAELTSSYSIAGALQVFWTPRLRSTFGASYAVADFKSGLAFAGNSRARDYNVATVMGNLIWSPVRGLDIGVEVLYSQANMKGTGVQDATTTTPRLTKKDDQVVARVRIGRDF
jgi:hypothetical protein